MSRPIGWQFYFFVLGYAVEHVGNSLLIYRLYKQKNVYGVSIDAQICLLIAAMSRAVWFDDTRLSGLWFAWAEIGSAIILHLGILWMMHVYKDSLLTKKVPVYFRWYSILLAAIFLSCMLHPGNKNPLYFVTKQMFVSLTMFIETLSFVAQLEHTKANEAVDGLNKGYLTCLGISRFIRIAFWMAYKSKIYAFWFLLLCDIIHTILLCVFWRNYLVLQKSLNSRPILAFHEKRSD